MENASKALIIAGAILLSILIISLGIGIYNMAAGTMGKTNIDPLKIQQFNSKFEDYEGTRVRGSNVNTLLNTVLNHNITEEDDSLKVSVTGDITLDPAATSITTKASAGITYGVTMVRSSTTGYITEIQIDAP